MFFSFRNFILKFDTVSICFFNLIQVPRAFVVLRPGFEETEENLTNLMESRLEDHERIRGGLYFVQDIPRDENWKVRRDILVAYQPKTTEEVSKLYQTFLKSFQKIKKKRSNHKITYSYNEHFL